MDFSNSIAMFDSPIQILVVLVIALVVFGPKKLPELGRQLGSALRELNKAKGEMLKSFSLDHEPEHEPYDYSNHYGNGTNGTGTEPHDYYAGIEPYNPPPDLTDYTIAGQPVADVSPGAPGVPEGTIARSANGLNGAAEHTGFADHDNHYAFAAPHEPASDAHASTVDTAAVEAGTVGEHHA